MRGHNVSFQFGIRRIIPNHHQIIVKALIKATEYNYSITVSNRECYTKHAVSWVHLGDCF